MGAQDAGRRGRRKGVSSWAGIFSDRNYALYALGNTISSLGMWAQRVGIGWLSWDLSHSASWVGLVSLSQYLPLIVFAPIFGSVLDRCDPKRYAMAANAVLTALAAALWIVAAVGAMTIERLCMLSVLLGVANGAYHPVRLSIVNEVAPPGRLAQAIATNSILFNLTRSIGPALAGVAIASLGIAATFAINAVSYAAIIGALAVITIHEIPRRPTEGFLKDFAAGVRYAAGYRLIRDLLLLSMVTSILGRGVIELLPAFAGGVYDRGSSGLAALTTASGIGAVLGGVLLSRTGSGERLPVIARRSAMWVGVAVVALGLAPGYGFAIAAVFLLNIVTLICNVGLQVVLQKSIDGSFRGRVLGLWGMCNVAGPGIGGALIGGAAHGLGLRGAAVASGVICSALAVWIVQGGRDVRPNL